MIDLRKTGPKVGWHITIVINPHRSVFTIPTSGMLSLVLHELGHAAEMDYNKPFEGDVKALLSFSAICYGGLLFFQYIKQAPSLVRAMNIGCLTFGAMAIARRIYLNKQREYEADRLAATWVNGSAEQRGVTHELIKAFTYIHLSDSLHSQFTPLSLRQRLFNFLLFPIIRSANHPSVSDRIQALSSSYWSFLKPHEQNDDARESVYSAIWDSAESWHKNYRFYGIHDSLSAQLQAHIAGALSHITNTLTAAAECGML